MAQSLRRGQAEPTSPERPPAEVLEDWLRFSQLLLPPGPPAKRRLRAAAAFLVVALAVLAAPTIAALAFDRATQKHLFPGTRIGGVAIGGVSVAEAEQRLREVFIEPLHSPLRLIGADATLKATPWELGVRVDVESVLRQAHEDQARVPLHERLWRRTVGDRRDISIESIVDTAVLRQSIDAAADRIDRPVRDADLEVTDDGKLKVIRDLTGRQVDRAGAVKSVVAALRRGDSTVHLPVTVTPAEITRDAFKQVIFIRTGANTLDLYEKGKIKKSYRVATGTGGYPTPKGLFRIVAKRRWPGWSNPNQPWSLGMPAYIPPGRNNPLGTRALYLSVGGIRIHGTPQSWSIGSNASHGCVRMHIGESEELFELVDVGTPVKIVY